MNPISPPPHLDFPAHGPRPARVTEYMTANLKSIRTISIVVVAIGMATVFYLGNQSDRLAKHGVVLQAKVTKVKIGTYKGSPTYSIEYAYRVDGYTYLGTRSIERTQVDEYRVGSVFPITLLRDNPYESTIGRVTTARGDRIRETGSLLVLGLSLIAAAGYFIERGKVQRELKMLQEWPAIPGRVLEVTPFPKMDLPSAILRYEAWLPSGETLERSQTLNTTDLPPIRPGDVFAVFLDPKGSRIRPNLYPRMALRKVELVPSKVDTSSDPKA